LRVAPILTPLPVSWNWGSGKPGGTVAEKKTSGEIAIKSKRGNTIKKNASADNPAVHVERSGNDVVKRESELNVEKKASSGGGKKRKSEKKDDEEEKGEEEGGTVENEDGKEVKATPKSSKKQKAEKKKDEDKEEADGEEKVNGEAKKGSGRPKGAGGAKTKKEKKPAKPRATEGIGSRTRSRA
jgi:Hypervirulence associated proteins TUDOR domain